MGGEGVDIDCMWGNECVRVCVVGRGGGKLYVQVVRCPVYMVDICKDHVSARAEEEVVVYLG